MQNSDLDHPQFDDTTPSNASVDATNSDETTHFGFARIAAHDKSAQVQSLFQSVATRYDMMNDLMSGGLHRAWKAGFVAQVNPRKGERILDVAGGTGDIARRLAQHGCDTILCDFSHAMIRAGITRHLDRGIASPIDYVVGDGMSLPFADQSFDALTIAFGLRNITDIDRALREFHRVLRYGGRLYCLEFSQSKWPQLAKIYDQYSFQILPIMGQV
ncbi:MAG: ubiquinone/menaquinone biosynthesis methyltransferase, partial [Pseudomonadota bacterium]